MSPGLLTAEERWYSSEQVKNGGKQFQRHCADCHKRNAEGTTDWKKLDSNGKYPPPPLNGSAHAWHHSIKSLSGTINNGGIILGGVMPPFKDKLKAEQVLEVIAFFQSKWSKETYAAWLKRNPLPALLAQPVVASGSEISRTPEVDPRTEKLRKMLPASTISSPQKTPVEGIFQVRVGSKYAYVTADGNYALIGNLLDLNNGVDLTSQAQARDNLPLLQAFPEKDRVVYNASGKEKARIVVFTDSSCPYCKKFHKEVPELQKSGISVHYIPFPRGMDKGPGFEDLLAVWCSKDRSDAMNIAMGVKTGTLGKADCGAEKTLRAGFNLGRSVGVKGTPTSFLPDGTPVSGYMPAKRLIERLAPQLK